MKWSTKITALVALLMLLAGACTFTLEPRYPADAAQGMEVIEVEVAENGYQRFAVDETPAFEEDGLPAYGAEFVTQGYLYPPGTITCEDGVCNGVLEDGSPEFPDKVIGEWSCWGFHVGDGGHTTSGPWVVSNQLFSFGDTPGAKSIVSIGYELADLNTPFTRSITGGTGEYSTVRGEQVQEALGFDMLQGVTLRVKLQVGQ